MYTFDARTPFLTLHAEESLGLDSVQDVSVASKGSDKLLQNVAPKASLVNFMTGDDFAGDNTTLGVVTIGAFQSGEIEIAGDEDWFALTLAAGDFVEISHMEGLGAFYDLVDSAGNVLADTQKIFSVIESYIYFQTDTAQTIYLSVTDDGSGQMVPYDFASRFISDDFAGDTTSTGTFGNGTLVSGSIDYASDEDFFSLAVVAGTIYQFTPSLPEIDLTLSVQDASGNFIPTNTGEFGEIVSFTASTTEILYLSAAAGVDYFGAQSYTVTLAEIVDDFAGDASTTGLAIGGSGAIEFDGDTDWFAITLSAGETLALSEAMDNDDIELSLYDSAGGFIAADSTTNNGDVQIFDITITDTYYVQAAAMFFLGETPYGIVANIIGDDFAGDASTTGIVSVGAIQTGSLEEFGDVDWFRLNLNAGDFIEIGFNQINGVSYEIVDQNGVPTNALRSSEAFNAQFLYYEADQAETLYFRVADDGLGVTAEYEFSSRLLTDDIPGSILTTEGFDATGTVSGVLEFDGDQDYFALSVEAVNTYELVLNVFDPLTVLTLVDANGDSSPLSFDFNQGSNATYTFTASETTDVFVVAQLGLTELLGGVQPYEITVTELADDYSADTSTTAFIDLSTGQGSITANIDFPNDSDWLAFTVAEGDVVDFDIDSENSEVSFAWSFNSEGVRQSVIPSSGRIIEFDVGGTYFIEVRDFDTTSFEYTISATVVADDLAQDETTVGQIELTGSADGYLINDGLTRDEDWFSFQAQTNDFVKFTIDVDRFHPVNLEVYQIDEFGTAQRLGIESFITNSNAELNFIAPTDGEYFVNVESERSSNADTAYTLFSEQLIDDHGDTIATATELAAAPVGQAATLVTGEIFTNNDIDVFEIITQSDIVRIAVTSPFYFNQFVNITDANGQSFSFTTEFNGSGYNYLVQGVTDGSVFFSLGNGSVSFNGSDFYEITAQDVVDDFGATAETAGVIENGQTVSVETNFQGDADWLAFEAEAGTFVYTQTSAQNNTLNVVTAQGFAVERGGADGTHFIETSGTYYIQSAGFGDEVQDITLYTDVIAASNSPSFLLGTAGDDTLVGGFFNDQLRGFDGDDLLVGGQSSDYLEGGAGADIIDGGDSIFDYLVFNTSDAGVTVDLLNGTGSGGHAEGDSYVNVERVIGSAFDDVLIGDNNRNNLYGTAGEDTLTGNGGRDGFVYRTIADIDGDIITDFSGGGDTPTFDTADFIDLFTIFQTAAFLPSFIGAAAFTGIAGEIRAEIVGADTVITIDETGDAQINATLTLQDYVGGIQLTPFNHILPIEVILGSELDDSLFGTEFADEIRAGDGNDFVEGQEGDDIIFGGAGADILFGDGQSVASFGRGDDTIYGGEGDDLLFGGLGDDRLYGDAGDDVLDGGFGTDEMFGGDGNDVLFSDAAVEVLDGGDGLDTAAFANMAGGIEINLANTALSTGDAQGDSYISIEVFSGTAFDDVFRGDETGNNFIGLEGRDIFYADLGADIYLGGEGDDLVNYMASVTGVSVNLTNGNTSGDLAAGDSFDGIEDLRGSNTDDFLFGSTGDNRLEGEGGDDEILGRAGDDVIFGDAGNDDLDGGGGNDNLFGGAGDDLVNGNAGDDRLFGGVGADVLIGGSGRDRAEYRGAAAAVTVSLLDASLNTGEAAGDSYVTVEDLVGSRYDDSLTGNDAVNRLFGGNGDDMLFGEGGLDRLYGGNGNDTLSGGDTGDYLYGGNGADTLIGGAGNDRLYGQGGADTFVFSAGMDRDTIYDFQDGVDLLDLSAFSAAEIGTALAGARQYGASVRLDFGDGDILIIRDMDIADFDATDIIAA